MTRRTRNTTKPTAKRRQGTPVSMQALVGLRTYTVWLEMLQRLVPQGRTHRMSVLVASFLQYAAEVAVETWTTEQPPEGTAAALLLDALEGEDEPETTMCALAEQLLRDAGVQFQRVNHRGQQYSIAEGAAREFIRWEDMPWE